MQTLQATVNPRLLTKASRLFTGTLSGRIIEILQNARRAGADEVIITNHDALVTVRDNGAGVDDFAKLLDLGGSDWKAALEQSEDPAGVGLFCLAPRAVTIRSNNQTAIIADDGWTGMPVPIQADPTPQPGMILEFPDEAWSKELVEPAAVFSGMTVVVDGQACATEKFLDEQAAHYPELGCRIEVRETDQLSAWHSRERSSFGNALVNFHGQVLSFTCHPVSERHLHFLIDLTDKPTGIRLMLPARTQLVENEAYEQLKEVLELEAYRYLQRRGHHRLLYKEYTRAHRLGFALPEATPTYSVGLLAGSDCPDPVQVIKPDDLPLSKCYRLDDEYFTFDDSDEANVHLLAALGKCDEPFVPVSIRNEYNGYSWSDLPLITKVEVEIGDEIYSEFIWNSELTCVESLAITAHTANGKQFSAPVCMAIATPSPDEPSWSVDPILVTPAAQQHLSASEIWYHLGGWHDEGDTYDTQFDLFEQELDRFWLQLIGPDEQLRQELVTVLCGLDSSWKSVKVFSSGKVRIAFKGKAPKIISPPQTGK